MRKTKLTLLLLLPTLMIVGCNFDKDSSSESTSTIESSIASESSSSSSVQVHTHNYGTLVEAVAATCTEDGHKAYYHCEECDKYFDANKKETTLEKLKIEATGHHYGNWNITTFPSTDSKGEATRICTHDSSHKETYELPTLKDTIFWSKDVKDATCTNDGLITYSSEYGSFEVIINKLNHNYGNWSITTKPTLTETGIATRICANNNTHKDTFTLPALSDSEFWNKTSSTSATCTTDGKDVYVNDTYGTVEVINKALNHNYSDWEIITKPTLTTSGIAKRICQNDNSHIDEVSLPILSDTSVWTKETTSSTCVTKGKDTYKSIYGIVEIELPLIEHDYIWIVDQSATATETGLKHEECTMCHNKQNENTVIPCNTCAHEHVNKVDEISATCETTGKKAYYYCSDCDKYYEDEDCQLVIDDISSYGILTKKDHNYTNWVITKQPTKEESGKAKGTCSYDETHISEISIPCLNDTNVWSKEITNATCQATGKEVYTSIYGKVEITLDKLPHSYGEYLITLKPTETTTGKATHSCNNEGCDEVEEVTLEVLSDTNAWDIATVELTSTTDGSITYTHKVYGIKITIIVKHIETGEEEL